MKIVLSAHFDLARPVMSIKMDDTHLLGLVDNFAGVFVSYQASRKTGIPVYFTNYEELEHDGADDVAKSLDKDTLVIVVDTCQDAEDKMAYMGNAYGIETSELKTRLSDKVLFKDGMYEEYFDETIMYGGKHKLKTFYYGVPIPNPHNDEPDPFPIPGSYHLTNNKVSLQALDQATDILVEIINYFKAK
jgi:hypothetical protein